MNLYTKYKQSRQNKKLDKLLRVSELMVDEFKCVICCEVAKNVIFKPCLHMAICSLCNDRLKERKCPICKREVIDIVTIYVA